MKKIIATLLILLLVATTAWAIPGNVDSKMKTTGITADIKAEGMLLQDFLDLLSERSGIILAAVPEVAGMKVDMAISAGQSVEAVLAELGRKYGLTGVINGAKTAIIVVQGAMYASTMYGAGGMPYLAAKTAYDSTAAAPVMMRESNIPAPPPPSSSPGAGYGRPPFNTEEYKHNPDNNFKDVTNAPLSTFSIDVDTASYSNMRRFINMGKLPPIDAVRTEELLNYFTYDYPEPTGEHPFSVTTEVQESPWNPGRKLVMVGLQGKHLKTEELPPSNLVFLIDISGSMSSPNKLPLLKEAFKMLVKQLRPQDKVAIVVYASTTGILMESTPGSEKDKIIAKIDSLRAGGSTSGGEGLKLAYKVARENFSSTANNRVILATDGDFNVGPSSDGELVRLIESFRNDGVFLSVLGFGMGNVKDSKMELLADKGNGNYAYIDNMLEAKKVLVSQMAGTLHTIAKDVKIQIEFNPAQVKSYRLIGYENRVLEDRDFNDDKKDAGDMGAGHSVTALYEIILAGSPETTSSVDPLKYQKPSIVPSDEMMQVKIRYKKPKEDTSILMTTVISGKNESLSAASENFRFAAAVVEYGMLLRKSEFKGNASYFQALSLARGAVGRDTEGYRAEFIKLMEIAQLLDSK